VGKRYTARVDAWRLPTSQAKRTELATAYGRGGFALLAAVYAPDAPGWLRELPAVEALRVVLLQNYTRAVTDHGREVVRRREAEVDGLPPGRCRLTSPYDTDARWGVKRDRFWNGYKVQVSETCEVGGGAHTTRAGGGQGQAAWLPNLITNVATTDATVADAAMTEPIHLALAARDLLPAEHYLDSGYPSAELVVSSRRDFGIALVTPVLEDTSPQARAGAGFDRAAFTVDWDTQRVTCPQGQANASWSPAAQRGTQAVVVKSPPRSATPARPVTSAPPPAAAAASSPCGPARSTRPSTTPAPSRTPSTGRPSTRCAPGSRPPSTRPSPSPACATPATAA